MDVTRVIRMHLGMSIEVELCRAVPGQGVLVRSHEHSYYLSGRSLYLEGTLIWEVILLIIHTGE